jgi:uncharacterized protein YoxC
MTEMDDLQKVFSDATNKMKVRVGQLEHEVKEKKEKIDDLNEKIAGLTTTLKDSEDGVELWRKTADSRLRLHNDYKDREKTAFETVAAAMIQYMDDYELFKDTSNKYAGAVLQGFKGLTKEQRVKYEAYIKKKTVEITNYVKRMKDGK